MGGVPRGGPSEGSQADRQWPGCVPGSDPATQGWLWWQSRRWGPHVPGRSAWGDFQKGLGCGLFGERRWRRQKLNQSPGAEPAGAEGTLSTPGVWLLVRRGGIQIHPRGFNLQVASPCPHTSQASCTPLPHPSIPPPQAVKAKRRQHTP